MSLIFNDQIKLPTTALDTAATSGFTVGTVTPVAGYLDDNSLFSLSSSPRPSSF